MTVRVRYFAVLRDQRGLSEETLETSSLTAGDLYGQLKAEHRLTLPMSLLKVAIGGEFVSMDHSLKEGDEVVFIPPVAGG